MAACGVTSDDVARLLLRDGDLAWHVHVEPWAGSLVDRGGVQTISDVERRPEAGQRAQLPQRGAHKMGGEGAGGLERILTSTRLC